MSPLSSAGRLRSWLPHGTPLPDAVWQARERAIRIVMWAHAPALLLLALLSGDTVGHSMFELLPLAVFGAAAELATDRRTTAVMTSIALLSCSAVLVHISGGVIEMHFHYFVMVALITLYCDWWPFLVSIGYVVFQHGVGATLDPGSVFPTRRRSSTPGRGQSSTVASYWP